MTAVGRRMRSTTTLETARDYAAALGMLADGSYPEVMHAITGLPLRAVLTLWDAMDGEASGTMRRFGSVIDPRYRPGGRIVTKRPSRIPAKLHLPTHGRHE